MRGAPSLAWQRASNSIIIEPGQEQGCGSADIARPRRSRRNKEEEEEETADEMPEVEKTSTAANGKGAKSKKDDGRVVTKAVAVAEEEEMVLGESPSSKAIELRGQMIQELVKIAVEKLSNESGTFVEPIKFEYFQQNIKKRRPDLASFGSRVLGIDKAEKNFGKSELYVALGNGVFSRRGESSRLMRIAPMKYVVGAEVEVYTVDNSIPGRFRARILQSIKDDQYEIEYLDFKDEESDASAKKGQNKVTLLKEVVSVQRVRPKPPRSFKIFKAGKPCEAEWEDGWYEAQVLEEMKTDGKYKVRFNESRAELLLPQKKVRDLVDWIEAEGKWVSVRRWEKPTGKESKDPAKSRKSKQNSKNQKTLEGNTNSKDEDNVQSKNPDKSDVASVAKSKRPPTISDKEAGKSQKGDLKDEDKKSSEKTPSEKTSSEKSQDDMKSKEKRSSERKPNDKKSNGKKPDDKKQSESEKKKVVPPKLGSGGGGGGGILTPFFKAIPSGEDESTDDTSRKRNAPSEPDLDPSVPKPQVPNKKSRASMEGSETRSGLKSKETKADSSSKDSKGRIDTKSKIETGKASDTEQQSSHQKEKRGTGSKTISATEQKTPSKEQKTPSKEQKMPSKEQRTPSKEQKMPIKEQKEPGTKRQRLSTSEAGSNPQQSELDKKDQPPEKQLQTRASKKQKIDQSPRTGELRSSSRQRTTTPNPPSTSTKRGTLESPKTKSKDPKKKEEAKPEEGRTKTGLKLYKQGAAATGTYIKVFWEGENSWFSGKIVGYSQKTKKHKVVYDDGETCEENLSQSKVELM